MRRTLLLAAIALSLDPCAPRRAAGPALSRPRIGRALLRPVGGLLDCAMAPLLSLAARRRRQRLLRNRPRRIILVRHGESVGNVDRSLYATMADPSMGLTEHGFAQGAEAGAALRAIVGDGSCRFYHSPYIRTRQTMLAMLEQFPPRPVQITVEPRLREQDFGNFQDPALMQRCMDDRKRFGRFFYRIPNGEAGTDVYDRVCDFWSGMLRSLDENGYQGGMREHVRSTTNVVLVTHGLLMRLFCMSVLKWTVSEFEQVWNPDNGEVWVLERPADSLVYKLRGRYELPAGTAPPPDGTELEAGGGWYEEVRFGANRSSKTPLPEHMKTPLEARLFTPGEPLDGKVELAHLAQLDGPSFVSEYTGG